MADDAHLTRHRLLDSALALAEDIGLADMSINDVVRQAEVAKGTFYVHFGDRTAFLVALHQRFHDELGETIRAKTLGLSPGTDRLRTGTTAYLDGCLRAHGVKAMLLQARGLPEIAEQVTNSNERFAVAVTRDLEALGIDRPSEVARLFVAMAAEVALLESRARRRNAKLRSALWQLSAGCVR